jgi:phosphomevalonate kinase
VILVFSIIALAGKQYSGKDTVAELLQQALPLYTVMPIARAIKEEFARSRNLSLAEVEAEKSKFRGDLIALGQQRRQQDPDYWLKQVLEAPGSKIISDVRLKQEFDILKRRGAFLIRVQASREVRALRGEITHEGDPTETELDQVMDWEAEIENSGSYEALQKTVSALVHGLREEGKVQ